MIGGKPSSLLIAALLWASVAPSAASRTLSGRYGPLALAVAADGSVHGVFAERRIGNGTPDTPQFGCLFLLDGRLQGETAIVTTWLPGQAERMSGVLRLGAAPSLQLEGNPGGCLMTSGDMTDAPYALTFDEPRANWIGTGLVTAERAILHPEPVERPARERPYLVRLDPVAILARRPGWSRVEYLEAGPRPVTGWLRDGDLAPDRPPLP